MGRLSAETQQKPKILQELQGTVLIKDNFQQQYKQCYGIKIDGPKICFRGDHGGSSCNGDSGGGMYLEENNQRQLIGVCSFGLPDCQNCPLVYTKVSEVLDWISEKVGIQELNMKGCGVTSTNETEETFWEKTVNWFQGRQVY